MNSNYQMVLKLSVVILAVVGIFVLAGMGKIDPAAALSGIVTVVGALVVALGISGGLSSGAAQLVKGQSSDTGPAVVVTPAKSVAPPASRGFVSLRMLGFLGALGLVAFALCAYVSGCKQIEAVFPELDRVEQIVATDLGAGKTPEQIEADVAVLLCGGADSGAAPLCVDAVIVVNDAVAFLIDTGVLATNPAALAHAKTVLGAEHSKLAARGIAR